MITGVTMLVHIVVSALFDLEEARPIIAFVRKVALKPIKIDLT